ncbi:MAG: asparagine synthase (glutamine-hydrolyzing) [Gammaproteobacteria bacterium]|nr:asparagine synthase (glutamine-hydrolyzing) [Gammaproteobacteria bacterium]
MSGIAGIVHFDGKPVEPDLMRKMIAVMAHRGPDGSDCWVDGPVALGQCLLHATPESRREKQPLTNDDGSLVLVMDGRVDNREELADRLAGKGLPLRDDSDAERVLRAYEAWGDSCPGYLLGDFSLAIWDNRNQTLFCARDHFGVKPFYYHYSNGLFAFASETKGLLACPEIPRRLNEARIADYLVNSLEGVDKVCTFYEDISRMPPAHTLTVAAGKIRLQGYWEPQPQPELRLGSDAEYEAAFLEVFRSAVACRLRSATPPAAMLSGGLDSSSVVGLARQRLPKESPLLTFSAVAKNTIDCVESQSIESVLALGGVMPTRVYPDEIESFHEAFDVFEKRQDEPFDSWMVIPLLMYAACRRQGCKTLLDGVPGDEVMSLPGQYIAGLLRRGRIFRACSEAAGMAKVYADYGYSAERLLGGYLRSALIPDWARRLRRRRRGPRIALQVAKEAMINPEWAKRIDLPARLERLSVSTRTPISADLQGLHAYALRSAYLTVGIERYDRVASTFGVEPRHPLLDKRFVEFSLSLPWSQKIRCGWPKSILRRASEAFVPQGIRWRTPGTNLAWLFSAALIASRYSQISEFLTQQTPGLARYMDRGVLRNVHAEDRHRSDKRDRAWHIFSLGQWLNNQTFD